MQTWPVDGQEEPFEGPSEGQEEPVWLVEPSGLFDPSPAGDCDFDCPQPDAKAARKGDEASNARRL